MTKLLLVEDDNNLREIYEARLQAEGYTIVSAHDGEEALVVAKAEKPDLIISDVMMPKISGFEMLDILRNTDGLQDVKVIMLTALGQSDDQQRADRLGADRYLVKSQVTLEDIVKVAHELLGDSGAAAAPADATASPTTDTAATTVPAPAPGPSATPPTTDPAPVLEPAAAPPADPVVTAPPVVEPAPIPEPVLAEPPAADPAPASDPTNASDTATTDAEPTANEEATVEAQIEDFVANTSAAAPAEPPATDPTAVEVADEKLVSDAADTFEASTKAAGEVAAEEKEATENQPQQKKVGGERVIEPIAGEPKKDLDALLAIEEAKEAQAQPVAPVIPVIVDNQKGPETPAAPPTTTVNPSSSPTDKVDPSNIAL